MDTLLAALRASAEPSRLRLLALAACAEMTVSELTEITGQAQPSVSRHLKVLCAAGLLDRIPEGTWVFYRLADEASEMGQLGRFLIDMLPEHDAQLTRDMARLEVVKQRRAAEAEEYFNAIAERWDSIRSLHVDEEIVEEALMSLLPPHSIDSLLDIGTGTGRMLELFGPHIDRGLGIDASRDMLSLARAKLEGAGLVNCQARLADMYRVPVDDDSFDAVIFHQVLHYADRPASAIAEAARVLAPGGKMLIVDFEAHDVESLRLSDAHRRLGFSDEDVKGWFHTAGLEDSQDRLLPGEALTVHIWSAVKPSGRGAALHTEFAEASMHERGPQ